MSEWRYIASRLNGDGTETFLDYDLPLSDVAIQEVVSGHGGLDGRINPEVARLKDADGVPIFVPWQTAIYAEASGQIRGGGLLTQMPMDGPDLRLDCIGFSGYLADQPFIWDEKYDRADPLVMDRFIWSKFQSQESFDIGIRPTGDAESQMVTLSQSNNDKKEFYYLGWWETLDLDRERTELAELGGYEWTVHHRWTGETIAHEIEYGYPKLGKRRHDLRFVVGENVSTDIAAVSDGDEYASHVLVLGAGQGRKMIRSEATSNPKRLGRWAVVSDKGISNKQLAETRANAELKALSGELDVTEVEVIDHPNAPIGSYRAGDEILVQSGPGWADFGDMWVRIMGITYRPEDNKVSLSVRRGEKISWGSTLSQAG